MSDPKDLEDDEPDVKWPDDGPKRPWWTKGPSGHVRKKPVRELKAGEEVFTIADIEEGLGLMGKHKVKQWAAERGLLREGRYTIAGRSKIKRMNYVERDGLVAILEYFRARQGVGVLLEVEKELGKMGARKERELKKVRGILSEKSE